MGNLLGLLAAACWGVGDFSGGMGVKAAGGNARAALRVVVMSHATSFCVLLTLGLLYGGPMLVRWPLAWGLAAGVFAGLSLSAFYVALSRGAMGASAAVSGLLAAAIPRRFRRFRMAEQAGGGMWVSRLRGWRSG